MITQGYDCDILNHNVMDGVEVVAMEGLSQNGSRFLPDEFVDSRAKLRHLDLLRGFSADFRYLMRCLFLLPLLLHVVVFVSALDV